MNERDIEEIYNSDRMLAEYCEKFSKYLLGVKDTMINGDNLGHISIFLSLLPRHISMLTYKKESEIERLKSEIEKLSDGQQKERIIYKVILKKWTLLCGWREIELNDQ